MNRTLSRIASSSSYQVGTVLAVLMSVALLFVVFWILLSDGDALIYESEEAVRAELRSLVSIHRYGGPTALENALIERLSDQRSDYFYALKGVEKSRFLANIPAWPERDAKRLKEGLVFFEFPHAALPERAGSRFVFSTEFDVIAKTHRFDSGDLLLVGRDIDDLQVAQFVASSLGWIIVIILITIFVMGYGVAYYVASRFDRIAETTDRIVATGNLSERLVVDGSWDDLSKLSALLNRMLEELQLRVDGIQNVSENIAHDLRTPLMRLRSKIDRLDDSRNREELVTELDGVLNVFQSLLRISAIEAGKQPISAELVDLAVICEDAVSMYQPVAEDRQLSLSLSAEVSKVTGDRDLLFQCVVNLIDNALKFSPPHGEVHCGVMQHEGRVVLSVIDQGPGIPESDRSRVLERFSRLDASRGIPGNGLGLSFVAAVIRRHGGQITLETGTNGEGLKISFTLQQPATL